MEKNQQPKKASFEAPILKACYFFSSIIVYISLY